MEETRVGLEVIDATLAGEPVDPIHAELAELALLLADARPVIAPGFAQGLDEAVARRFAHVERRDVSAAGPAARRSRRRWWLWTPAAGLAAVLLAAVVIVAAGGWRRSSPSLRTAAAASGAPERPASAPSGAGGQQASPSGAATFSAPGAVVLAPPANGRKVIQGAELSLSAASNRLEQVAQEVFVVVGQVRGIVKSSTVTAAGTPGGYAQFQLSIPSSALPQAMASLSALRYAKVASRTDTTQDVNDRYGSDVRALADARALRTSLLKQLAAATSQAQIDSLTARIHDAEASIASDQATLRNLNGQIGYSQVGVTINGGAVPGPLPTAGAGGFGLGQAAHDAGRVLTVAAAVALIAGAALIPASLLGGLLWWIAAAVRRRRREQTLDLA